MSRLQAGAARTLAWPIWARLGGSASIVLCALGIRYAMFGPQQGYPYLTFFFAVFAVAILFGTRLGLLATIASTAIAVLLFVPPVGPQIDDPREAVAALVFAATGVACVWLTSAVRSALRERDDSLLATRIEQERLRGVLDSIGEPFYAIDADWRIIHASRVALDVWNRRAEDVIGRRVLDALPEALGSEPYAALELVMRTREAAHLEAISGVTKRWVSVDIYPARGGGLLVAFRDIQARKQAEDRQHLLLGELTHRIKNTLTLVLAVADQTRRHTTSLDEFHAVFTDRILTLARAHDALRRDGGTETTLETVTREALASHLGEASARLELCGPHVRLSASTAVALAMALHELATNAVKHGALAMPNGRIRVTWKPVEPGEDHRARYDLLWVETGGPPVSPSVKKRGFGMRLLERGLPAQIGGEVAIEFAATGLRCRIQIPAFTSGHPTTDDADPEAVARMVQDEGSGASRVSSAH